MKNLIIYCHPNPKSFNHAILETTESVLLEMGHEIRSRDLYSIGLNPVLDVADFEMFQSGTVPADIDAEQKEILWADRLIFIYPIWWTGMPARMKGYIDRIFFHGFAYEFRDGAAIGLLTNKEVLLVNTSGTPNEMYAQLGMDDVLKKTSDSAIFQFCGMKVLDHVFFGAVPHVTDQVRKDYLLQWKNTLQKYS